MLAMLGMLRRRVIVVGAGGTEKRAAEATKRKKHIHETKFEAIQSSDPADGFRRPDPQCRNPALPPAKSLSIELKLFIHRVIFLVHGKKTHAVLEINDRVKQRMVTNLLG
jgi:hypothetical protein